MLMLEFIVEPIATSLQTLGNISGPTWSEATHRDMAVLVSELSRSLKQHRDWRNVLLDRIELQHKLVSLKGSIEQLAANHKASYTISCKNKIVQRCAIWQKLLGRTHQQ